MGAAESPWTGYTDVVQASRRMDGKKDNDGLDLGVHGMAEVPEGVRAAVVAGARQKGIEVNTAEQGSRSSCQRTRARHRVPL